MLIVRRQCVHSHHDRTNATHSCPVGNAFHHLTTRENHPVDYSVLRLHLEHRWFSPCDSETIDSLIDDAVQAGILTDQGDGTVEYTGEFASVQLEVSSEVQLNIAPS